MRESGRPRRFGQRHRVQAREPVLRRGDHHDLLAAEYLGVLIGPRRPRSHGDVPGSVWRSAASTDSQNRCGSRSSRPTGTHAARPVRPAAPIHDRSSIVLPLPGGADTTVTRADAPSRCHRPGQDTTAARDASGSLTVVISLLTTFMP
jgi:hypothetical protein